MRYILLALAITFSAAATGCSTNPATGRSQFNVISDQREAELGAQSAPIFLKEYGGDVPSTAILQYVSDLGHRLAAVSERPNLPWEFHVLDSETINAFALPGGKVFISRGLLQELDSEAQLAGVLGHEVGHVTAQHIGQQMSRALGFQIGMIALGVAAQQTDEDWLRTLGIGAQAGGALYLLKFGRDQELQADALGVRYMTRLGYNPVAQLQVMQVLQGASSGQARSMEILSTHPLPQTRIDRLEKLIRKKYPDYDDPAAYTFEFDRFNNTVLRELSDLHPPRHRAGQSGQTR